MSITCENIDLEKYYTALEVAQITEQTKANILYRCKTGFYEGAVKTPGTASNPHGAWMVPKAVIDAPTMTQDVAILSKQINPADFQRTLIGAINSAVESATEPLREQLEAQAGLIAQQQASIEQLTRTLVEAISESSAPPPKKLRWWSGLFGE